MKGIDLKISKIEMLFLIFFSLFSCVVSSNLKKSIDANMKKPDKLEILSRDRFDESEYPIDRESISINKRFLNLIPTRDELKVAVVRLLAQAEIKILYVLLLFFF